MRKTAQQSFTTPEIAGGTSRRPHNKSSLEEIADDVGGGKGHELGGGGGDLIKSCIELLRPTTGLTNDHCAQIRLVLNFLPIQY